jgi:G:T-mismatch repair DNA endonuclease (very short patch repair protein)
VFRGTWAVREGILSRDQLRSSTWRRLRSDVYADVSLPVDHLLHTRGVSLVMPPEAAFAGLTAVALWGGREFASADDAVEVVVPRGVRWQPGPGVAVRTSALDGDVVHDPPRLRRTGRVRTAVDLVRRAEVDAGVVVLDRLVATGIVRLDEVRDAVATLPRGRGSKRAREIVGLADGMAESPPETRLRLLMLRAGLPAPVAQFRVFDGEGLIGRVDFAYPESKIAIEYDGLWHAAAGQFAKDRGRLNRLQAAGWRVIFVTAADMHDPDAIVRQIVRALAE